MKKLLLFLFLFVNLAFAYQNRYTREQVIKDFNSGNTAKYHDDHLQELDFKTLQRKGILSNESLLTNNSVTVDTLKSFIPDGVGNIYQYYKCPAVNSGWTDSVWDIDFKNGEVKCAVAQTRDLYNPIGYFVVNFPKTLAFFKKDTAAASVAMQSDIATSNKVYKQLYSDKYRIANSVNQYAGQDYLNIPDLLLSAILTDVDIIDVKQTKASNRLTLKDGFNSAVLDSSNGNMTDNTKYISARAATLVDVYAKLSDLSLKYLMYLAVFFGAWGLGRFTLPMLSDKFEGVSNQHERKTPFLFGLIVGVLLFFPTSDGTLHGDPTAGTTQNYNIMHTNYQRYEKSGYYLFMNWAEEATKAIIDSELDSIIDRSGLSSADTLIDAYAYKEQYKKLKSANDNIIYSCNSIYDNQQTRKLTGNENKVYPTSENYTYANSIVQDGGADYYLPTDKGGFVQTYLNHVPTEDGSYYPTYMLSECGKAAVNSGLYQNKIDDFASKLANAGYHDPAKLQKKVDVIRGLIKFQYELYRDYGILAVLGLPVTILQTENIGTMLDNKNKVMEKLNEGIEKDSIGGITYTVMSSLPYLWLPGGFATFEATRDAIKGGVKIASGTLAKIPLIGDWLSKSSEGIGGIAGVVLGAYMAVIAGKTLLALSPIIGIVLMGLLRFVVIYIKIFSFHFISIFILPVMFAKENIRAISSFTMKILATMLELPIFVLSIWLAITANSIIHSIGDAFSKKIILGMLQQNELQHNVQSGFLSTLSYLYNGGSFEWTDKLKIYLYDGVMEIGVAVFSLVIIYKIIVSIHTSLFEVLEIHGAQSLDNSLESMKNEAGSWGTKI